jgi:hypothetical protein
LRAPRLAGAVAGGLSVPRLVARRRRRSIALALALAGFALIFYILTIAKMGPALFERAL